MVESNDIPLTQFDTWEQLRCPQLGEPARFAYCRRMNGDLPCPKLYSCWGERINLDFYLRVNFEHDDLVRIFQTPSRGRMDTVFDTLNRVLEEKAKKA